MIYVRADDQENPHSDIQVEIKGDGMLILHEACTMLNEIYKIDIGLFDDIVQGVIRKNEADFRNRIERWEHDSRTE